MLMTDFNGTKVISKIHFYIYFFFCMKVRVEVVPVVQVIPAHRLQVTVYRMNRNVGWRFSSHVSRDHGSDN